MTQDHGSEEQKSQFENWRYAPFPHVSRVKFRKRAVVPVHIPRSLGRPPVQLQHFEFTVNHLNARHTEFDSIFHESNRTYTIVFGLRTVQLVLNVRKVVVHTQVPAKLGSAHLHARKLVKKNLLLPSFFCLKTGSLLVRESCWRRSH